MNTLRERLEFFRKNYHLLIAAALVFFITLVPQLSYWYYVSGEWFFNPYEGEGFDFRSPDFNNAFFSMQNGWLVYTPLMAFALLGLIYLVKKAPVVLASVLLFTLLNSWIHFSYYTVNFFPGLGCRPMIDSYPLLAFGLAGFFSFCSERKWLRILSIIILIALSALIIFQTVQEKAGVMNSGLSNRTYYWETFWSLKLDKTAVIEFDSNENQPQEDKVEFVSVLHQEDFEENQDTLHANLSEQHAYSGSYSLLSDIQHPHVNFEGSLGNLGLQGGDYVRASVYAYRRGEHHTTNHWALENFVVTLEDEVGKERKSASIKIPRHIKNDRNSIYHSGVTDVWDEVDFFVKIPRRSNDNWTLKVFVLNQQNQKLFLDDFRVERFRCK